ncbi:MAG: saccharopine dehydrogenase C-terminal domain-containing protein [Thermovirgaceae bacterium]|jgi:saccharopine dehydrogenase-like NADP-dependent oxidoreductase|nr:saccharopine dehydrogenase C-terminal domain-containing protein [Synergistales bacterium]MDI9393554.1 saccharopine dehydrogenase C-terminal domain-containing protein [Synergistota bacterium]MDD5515454.1 saccharopine dehydrogenase C-terminal domain-containing protein [Synergistales bacterium]HOP52422.1 saccharopine dehydrogenase C-terminal domain-containing protein [Synergistales bacterium]HPE91771.1 saccharopine dehydrogenase C-terminal domain-containing protein [Synergistales bacterium]
MKKVLVLGAGRVSRPCVDYLGRLEGTVIHVADVSEENLRQTVSGIPGANIHVCDAGSQGGRLIDEIGPDIVINLLPPAFMPPMAKECLKNRIPLVHPAYLDKETKDLSKDIAAAGVTFVTELGLDPGIDHMSAARTIDRIRREGGEVESFRSICGAIPSADANTNPWGYKLSWAPASLIGASKRDARVMIDGRTFEWPDGETYEHVYLEEIEGLGWFEVYANADSLPYLDVYGIPEAKSIYRGTIRYPGWCETICKMNSLGLFEENILDMEGKTFSSFMAEMAGLEEGSDIVSGLCKRLRLEPYSTVMLRFRWLGLLDDGPVPFAKGSPRDVVSRLFAEKLVYDKGEKDLVILQDEFIASFKGKDRKKVFRSTLIDVGVPGGDTSIARTTGLPPAIAARFILEGKIRTPGVHIPVLPEIYGPVMEELERLGVSLKETVTEI